MSNGFWNRGVTGRGARGSGCAACVVLLLACARVAAAPAGAEETLVRGAIGADALWSGNVTVVGQVIVAKGATLTILPGTTVRFAWLDEDGNGIGDGELTVEGTLVARGTAERPIAFRSARESPGPRDWTFVQISTSRDSVVEHCVFEHAFTGLQVHLSAASVRHSLFRNNFEGLRFSTSEIAVECNEFSGNTYGIRYESRGSSGVIAGNTIRGNDYGFFAVVKCASPVRISGNNVVNATYNVKMGADQREDVDFRGNWWGSASREAVVEGFFDKRREPTVGRVLFEPYLERAVEPCGVQ